ncbi:MAG: Carboxypeptidase Taq [Candidatus Moranbacteria bacterium GW2011_GWE1_36_7]|nr:MAG: Carboxypeptidase Taq [Candidatus Moranbacteria bacterium GW2011_GWE1_36_7]
MNYFRKMKKELFEELKTSLLELSHIGSAMALLHWDQEVYMPKNGAEFRAKTLANLAGIMHEKFVSKEFEKLLKQISKLEKNNELNKNETIIFSEIWRQFSREKKLPLEFVRDLTETCSNAQSVWAEARKKSDFKIFLPFLEKIVELKRKEAELVGFEDSPYDALLDEYEPQMTSQEVSIIFYELKEFLVDFLKKIKKSKIKINPTILNGKFETEKQKKFNEFVIGKMGFDFGCGRLDTSTHPFSTSFNPEDTRITTSYDEKNLFYSLSSAIHETGHALYEQGLLSENFGTPLGESISHGIHESQSRIWEKIVGQNINFWKYFYPKLKKEFSQPFEKISLEEFYKNINYVKPSLIRTESDEVTYNLHIILRFEIEKDLIEGTIEAKDLPKIWNSKMKEYLGVNVPNDASGILQDVHWSGGSIGYFPTYALGNLYSAQIFDAAKKDILNLEKEFALGNFEHFREWLRNKIHIHGKTFSANGLIKEITGEELNSKYFIDYITDKYKNIYEL